MPLTHVIVDGSNIATEGRALPSLAQLDDAVRQFQDEFPDAEAVVVVDATFGHRIDPSELRAFEEAVAHGELVSPPAGAIGRGDAFVLRIAERVGGQVLSNDSFQEFHAEHPWLFDEGRLIGGKPVPGVGWIFTPRLPVRGPRSRATTGGRQSARGADGAVAGDQPRRRRRGGRSAAVLEAVEAAAAEATEAATAPAAEDGDRSSVEAAAPTPKKTRRRRRRGKRGDPEVAAAIAAATEEAIGSDQESEATTTRSRVITGPQAVNDPLPFIQFISDHPIGERVTGTVSNFVSHGAMVDIGDLCCYVPLSGLGSPPPKSARAVLSKGETRPFVVAALDPSRRGVQLALPEVFDAAAGTAARTPDGPPTADRRSSSASKATPSPPSGKKAAVLDVAQGARSARATDTRRAADTGKAAKATKATKVPTVSGAAKATKATKAAKAATKAAKATKATRATRATKATKATGATKATKATKAAKAANAAPRTSANRSGRRRR